MAHIAACVVTLHSFLQTRQLTCRCGALNRTCGSDVLGASGGAGRQLCRATQKQRTPTAITVTTTTASALFAGSAGYTAGPVRVPPRWAVAKSRHEAHGAAGQAVAEGVGLQIGGVFVAAVPRCARLGARGGVGGAACVCVCLCVCVRVYLSV